MARHTVKPAVGDLKENLLTMHRRNLPGHVENDSVQLMITSPPYADFIRKSVEDRSTVHKRSRIALDNNSRVKQYSDDSRDFGNLSYDRFLRELDGLMAEIVRGHPARRLQRLDRQGLPGHEKRRALRGFSLGPGPARRGARVPVPRPDRLGPERPAFAYTAGLPFGVLHQPELLVHRHFQEASLKGRNKVNFYTSPRFRHDTGPVSGFEASANPFISSGAVACFHRAPTQIIYIGAGNVPSACACVLTFPVRRLQF